MSFGRRSRGRRQGGERPAPTRRLCFQRDLSKQFSFVGAELHDTTRMKRTGTTSASHTFSFPS
jgi:hypothetical protein